MQDDGDAPVDVVRGAESAREAVNLVLRDVESAGASEAIDVVFGSPDELAEQLRARVHRSVRDLDICGWVFVADDGAISISTPKGERWADFLVRMADLIQEAIIESPRRWGAPFPPCPKHPNHPMDAKNVEGVASWVCPTRSAVAVPIGRLAEADR